MGGIHISRKSLEHMIFKYIHYSSDLNEPPFLRKTSVIPSGPALEIFGILLRTSSSISVVTSILVKIPCHTQYIVQPDLY